MSYIGTPPSNAFTSLLKQDFTTSVTTGYTLNHAVNNANDIALFINFVRQEPTAAYSASGTTLTLTSATASTDDMYCVYLGQALQTVNPPNASVGLSQLSATGTKDATTFLRGDNTFQTIGTNTPSFHVLKDAAQSVADSTSTVMTWQTESWDTNNAFASNKFTVPSGEGGKYFIYASLVIDGIADGKVLYAQIRKNGSILLTVQIHTGSSGSVSSFVSGQIELAATDYVEISALHNHGSARDIREGTNPGSFFGGFKIIGA
jgi:hypothetical protein